MASVRSYDIRQVVEMDTLKVQEFPCGGATEGRQFRALVGRCVENRNDGSAKGHRKFIQNCRDYGMSDEQVTAASWIREELLTPKAKAQVEARLDRCGTKADEMWGEFNPNPTHKARNNEPR